MYIDNSLFEFRRYYFHDVSVKDDVFARESASESKHAEVCYVDIVAPHHSNLRYLSEPLGTKNIAAKIPIKKQEPSRPI